jgi:hypothetical protein
MQRVFARVLRDNVKQSTIVIRLHLQGLVPQRNEELTDGLVPRHEHHHHGLNLVFLKYIYFTYDDGPRSSRTSKGFSTFLVLESCS